MIIRDCRPVDGPAVAPLLAQLGYPTSADQATRRIRSWVAGPDLHLLLAEVDQAVAGLAALCLIPLIHRDQPRARLMALVVDQQRRGAGIGGALLDRVEQLAQQAGSQEMEVTSARNRENAHRFYRAHGYHDWSDSLRFRKDLAAS